MARQRKGSGGQALGEATQAFCANCGVQVHRGGPAPEDGRRFCSKPRCRSVRDAEKYARKTAGRQVEDAPTKCSNCDAPLPPRKRRRGDTPLGRWCRRAACQRNRYEVLRAAGLGDDPYVALQRAKLRSDFALAVVEGRFVECPACGLENALPDFMHPGPNGPLEACQAVGTNPMPGDLASRLWADRWVV